jgi:phosphatidylserine/phosphatidylglycerophosphate/cardiolipin synthase-like enzyme
LAIAAIESCKKLFLPAVALIYKNKQDQEALLGVAIDGKVSGEHEKAVSQNASFARFLAAQPPRYAPGAVLSSEAQESLLQASSQAEQIRSASSVTEAAIADAEEALSKTESVKEAGSLRSRLRDLEEELVKLKNEAKVIPVRNIYVYDHPPLLHDALKNSIERLLIISPWITGQVVDPDFLKDLEQVLKKSLRVYIGHGIAPNTTKNPHPNDAAAKAKLEGLSRRFSNFKFIRLGNTHAKVLIKDHDFAAIGSFNWLSL